MTHDQGHDHDQTHAHDSEHHHVALTGEEYVVAFRKAKDAFMRESPQSPLSRQSQGSFEGLAYYPYNSEMSFELRLDRNIPKETLTMDTSSGAAREYVPAGKIRFEVEGQPSELTIYGEGADLFLPLRDATSGTETYGAGRYLDPEMLDDDMVSVDFNLLYNPYCAYDPRFSCPLPPVENWLHVPIRAGEKTLE